MNRLKAEYHLSPGISLRGKWGQTYAMLYHQHSSYFGDFYGNLVPESPETITCFHPEGRVKAWVPFYGHYIPGQRNPGVYARIYGAENLKHVAWHRATQFKYDDLNGFDK